MRGRADLGWMLGLVAVVACTRTTKTTRPEPLDLEARDEAPPALAEDPSPPPAPATALASCAGDALPIPEKPARATCDDGKTVERISLLHVGDMHGHFHSYMGGRSPFAILRGFADRRRRETGGRVLFVDAGDDLEKGSLAEIRSHGEATLHLIDRLGLDVRTLGNHDFAWGEASVLAQAASAAHEVLASNLAYTGNGAFGAKRTTVIQVGCARVGLFGLVTNPYDETDDRVDTAYLGTFAQEHDPGDVDKYVGVAAARVRELRDEQKVDTVIAVDHLGLWKDKALVDAVPGLDLVVSAHDHVAVPGYLQGRHGVVVSSGTFLGARSDARVGEAVLEIDTTAHTAKLVSAWQTRVEELRDVDDGLQAEVDRLTTCFAPDADRPIADVDGAVGNGNPDSWMPMMDAAIHARFPDVDAILYEAWIYGGIAKGDLPRGPVTPQQLADFSFSERQKAGGPGFTAFVELSVSGAALREICASPLREPSYQQRMHRVCPAEIRDDASYTIVVERRPLHAPRLAFASVPSAWPSPPDTEERAVEAMDLLIDYARIRGRACKALDRDAPATCR